MTFKTSKTEKCHDLCPKSQGTGCVEHQRCVPPGCGLSKEPPCRQRLALCLSSTPDLSTLGPIVPCAQLRPRQGRLRHAGNRCHGISVDFCILWILVFCLGEMEGFPAHSFNMDGSSGWRAACRVSMAFKGLGIYMYCLISQVLNLCAVIDTFISDSSLIGLFSIDGEYF